MSISGFFWLAFVWMRSQSGQVFVEHPAGVIEYERASLPRIQRGEWKKYNNNKELDKNSVVYVLGSRAAVGFTNPGVRVVEFFVAGRPEVPGHELLSWEAPPEAFSHLFDAIPLRGGRLCVLVTPRTRAWSARLLEREPVRVSLEEVVTPSQALRKAGRFARDECRGYVLTNDFDVLNAVVLEAFLRVQAGTGRFLIGRTRHEILLGAMAAVEPQVVAWDPAAPGAMGAQIFQHSLLTTWLGAGRVKPSPVFRPQFLSR